MKLTLTLNKIFAYIIAFLLLLDGSTMWQTTGIIPLTSVGVRVLIILITLIAVVSVKPLVITFRLIGILSISLIWFLIFAIASRYNLLSFFGNFVAVYLSLFLYSYVMLKNGLIMDLVSAFMNIWLIIAGVTSLMWLFGSILRFIPLTPTTYEWAGAVQRSSTFYNLYFENPIQNTRLFGHIIARNTGIYAEAPGFSSYFLYAFGIEMSFFSEKKGHKRRLLFLLLTSLTSFSTKAILFLIIIFVVNYLISTNKNRKPIYQLLRILISVVLLVLGSSILYSVLLNKMDTGSFSIRMDDVVAAIKTWRSNPIFGVGLGNNQPIISNFLVSRSNYGLSMGLTVLLAQMGLWMTVYYLAPLFFNFIITDNTKLKKAIFILSLSIVINLVVSNIILTPALLIFMALGYAYLALSGSERNEI